MTVFLLEEIKQKIYLQRFILVICLMEEYFYASNVICKFQIVKIIRYRYWFINLYIKIFLKLRILVQLCDMHSGDVEDDDNLIRSVCLYICACKIVLLCRGNSWKLLNVDQKAYNNITTWFLLNPWIFLAWWLIFQKYFRFNTISFVQLNILHWVSFI